MISRDRWKRLAALGARIEPPIEICVVYCGWDPRDPRRAEYQAYKDAWEVGTPDPAFTKGESAGPWENYHFDHTKVPIGWDQSVTEDADGGDQTLATVGKKHRAKNR